MEASEPIEMNEIDEKPLISVIVPIYNAEEYIDRCMESLQHQTYPNLEILLINGGSEDNSAMLCDSMSTIYSNMKTINEAKNFGVSHSRNNGIALAKGTYITFVDADDWLEPDMIEQLYLAIKRDTSDLAGCGFSIHAGKNLKLQKKAFEKEELSETITAKEFLQKRILFGDTRCWSKLYRTDVIKKNGLQYSEDLTIGEDTLFLVQFLQNIEKVSILENYKGYCYYRNEKGAMLKPFKPQAMDQITCWEQIGEALGSDRDEVRFHWTMLVSIMLVVGRIAILSKAEQKKYQAQLKTCKEKLNAYYTKSAFAQLDRGYKLKVTIFRISPALYLKMYNVWKH